jgi:hypothetical protein
VLVLEIIGKELHLHLLVSLVGRGRRLAISFLLYEVTLHSVASTLEQQEYPLPRNKAD